MKTENIYLQVANLINKNTNLLKTITTNWTNFLTEIELKKVNIGKISTIYNQDTTKIIRTCLDTIPLYFIKNIKQELDQLLYSADTDTHNIFGFTQKSNTLIPNLTKNKKTLLINYTAFCKEQKKFKPIKEDMLNLLKICKKNKSLNNPEKTFEL